MHEILVVADDLTGANDTGHRFASRGFTTEIVNSGVDSEASVLVVNTDSRYAHPTTAADRVEMAVDNRPANVIYKKIDSTLRGNIVAEVDATMESAEAKIAIVAPAFPRNGRKTVGGYHLVHGTPVAETQAGRDADQPVTSSHLPTLFDSSKHPVSHIPLDVVADGPESVRGALSIAVEDEAAIVTCDATRPGDLAAVAGGAAALDTRAAYVGSGGLAGHVNLSGDARCVLGVVGSVNETTMGQLDAISSEIIVALDSPGVMSDSEAPIDDAVDDAMETLGSEGTAVLTGAMSRKDVEATLAAAQDAGVSEKAARDKIADALGQIAAHVHDRISVDGMFLSGGSVAKQALNAIDSRGIRAIGRSVGTGVPVGRVIGGPADGMLIVTKAGAFGSDEAILNCVDFLARSNADL